MLKKLIRKCSHTLHFDITQNLKYDRLTNQIISAAVTPRSTCIDVGCHKGEILDLILKKAPHAGHFAFEPLPGLYEQLVKKYSASCTVYPYALGDKEGETLFQFVKNAPAYSGILKRKYAIKNPEIQEIKVPLKTLDGIIPENKKITLLKIDVEGGEFSVLRGAEKTLQKNKPVVIFECGLGASDYYGTKPEDVYDFLSCKTELNISLLECWLKKMKPLTKDEFCTVYYSNAEYYFVAHP